MASKAYRKGVFLLVAALLVGVASWALYSILNEGAGDVLKMFGVTNSYAQGGIIILVVVALLMLMGWKGQSALKKIIG